VADAQHFQEDIQNLISKLRPGHRWEEFAGSFGSQSKLQSLVNRQCGMMNVVLQAKIDQIRWAFKALDTSERT
jgi:hypothetical protein